MQLRHSDCYSSDGGPITTFGCQIERWLVASTFMALTFTSKNLPGILYAGYATATSFSSVSLNFMRFGSKSHGSEALSS